MHCTSHHRSAPSVASWLCPRCSPPVSSCLLPKDPCARSPGNSCGQSVGHHKVLCVPHRNAEVGFSPPGISLGSGAQLTLIQGIKDSPVYVLELWTKSLLFQPQKSKTNETRKQSILLIKNGHISSTFWSADGKLYHGRISLSQWITTGRLTLSHETQELCFAAWRSSAYKPREKIFLRGTDWLSALTIWVLCLKRDKLKTSSRETKYLEKAQQCQGLMIFSRGEEG